MKKFYLFYDNGSGYFEGPYAEESNNLSEAIDQAHLRWSANQGGVAWSHRSDYDPNRQPYVPACPHCGATPLVEVADLYDPRDLVCAECNTITWDGS